MHSYFKKSITLFVLIIIFANVCKAQTQLEIKVNPILLLFEIGQISLEAVFEEDFGVGFDMLAAGGEFLIAIPAKYYLNPKRGSDRFGFGIFGIAGSLGAGAGFLFGYKWVSARNVVLDFDIGIGRGTNDLNVVPYVKLGVGYRFKL